MPCYKSLRRYKSVLTHVIDSKESNRMYMFDHTVHVTIVGRVAQSV
jgi:hypothetical protein